MLSTQVPSSTLPQPPNKRPSDHLLPSWAPASSTYPGQDRQLPSDIEAYQNHPARPRAGLQQHHSSHPQPPTPSTASSSIDSYPFSRPPSYTLSTSPQQSNPSSIPPYGGTLPSPTSSSASGPIDSSYAYTTRPTTYSLPSSTQQPTLPSYTTLPSPTQQSPSTRGGIVPVPPTYGPSSGMAPPQSYRPYPYQSLPHMNGSVMSNIHQPGNHVSMIPGMMQPQYPQHMMYGQQPPVQQDRPFKCDQCVQSFSRNHDLKRHKRIHLAIKPFPCNFCSKTFSRKDALKRHRLVKGCELRAAENGQTNSGDGESDNHNTPGSQG